MKRILLRMVRPTEGLEVTSNRIQRKKLYQASEASDRVSRVLDKLIQARLVRLTEGDTPDDVQVEVAHEALIRNWPRLVNWLEDERVNIRQRLRLTIAAEEWKARGGDRSTLLRGALLKDAQKYEDLSDLEKDFILHSRRAELNNRRLILTSVTGVFLALAGLTIYYQRVNANTRTQVEQALLNTVSNVAVSNILEEHAKAVNAVSFSPNGKILATASGDKTVKLWDTATGQVIKTLSGHTDSVNGASFSPDGKMLATASGDNTVRLWRLDYDNLLRQGCVFMDEYFKTNPDDADAEISNMCRAVSH
ncbi:hypothetical protein HW132_22265 [Brasilonema sp. CT11]|nr:hypothetical protein [Brasilonema sp. CT11]